MPLPLAMAGRSLSRATQNTIRTPSRASMTETWRQGSRSRSPKITSRTMIPQRILWFPGDPTQICCIPTGLTISSIRRLHMISKRFVIRNNHNHRPCRWFAPAPVGHVNRLSLKAHRRVCQPHDFYRHAPKGAFSLAAFYWLTRERVDKLFYTQLIIFIILL